MKSFEESLKEHEYMWTTELDSHKLLCVRPGEPEIVLKYDDDGNSYMVIIESDMLAHAVMEKLLEAGAEVVYYDKLDNQNTAS